MKISSQEHQLLSAKLISIFLMLKAGLFTPAITLIEDQLKTKLNEDIWLTVAAIGLHLSTRQNPSQLKLTIEEQSLTRLVDYLQASLPILPLLTYYAEKIYHWDQEHLLDQRSLYIKLIEADPDYKEVMRQEGLDLIKESSHLINGQSHLISFLKTEALPTESITADLLKQMLGHMDGEFKIHMQALRDKTDSQSILPNIISTLLSRMDKQTLANHLSAFINDKGWTNVQAIVCVISIAQKLAIPINASLKSHIDKIVATFFYQWMDKDLKALNLTDYFTWLRLVSDNSGITVSYIFSVYRAAYNAANKIEKPFLNAFYKEIFNLIFQDKALLQDLINVLKSGNFGHSNYYYQIKYEQSLKETIENQILEAMIIHRSLSQEAEVLLLEMLIPEMYTAVISKRKEVSPIKLAEFIHDVLNREADIPNSAYLNNQTIRTQFMWLMRYLSENVDLNKQETLPPISFKAMERLLPDNKIKCYFDRYDKKNVNCDGDIRGALKYLGDNCKQLLKTKEDLATFYRIFYPDFAKEEYFYDYEPLNRIFSSDYESHLLLMWHISLEQGALWQNQLKKEESRIVDLLAKSFVRWHTAGMPKGDFDHPALSFILEAFVAKLPEIKESHFLSRVYYIGKEISSFFSSSKDAANIVANYLAQHMKTKISQPYNKEMFNTYKDKMLELYALFNTSAQALPWIKKEPILEIIQKYFYKDTEACINSMFDLAEDYADIVDIIDAALGANILEKPNKNSFIGKLTKTPYDVLVESKVKALDKIEKAKQARDGLQAFSIVGKGSNEGKEKKVILVHLERL